MRKFVFASAALGVLAALAVSQAASAAVTYKLTDLGTIGGAYALATGGANGPLATGNSTTAGAADHAFLYSNGAMKDLGTLGGVYSQGLGVNAAGQVAGVSATASGATHAFLYSNGVMTDLGSLADVGHRSGDSQAAALNASGQVVGSSDAGRGGVDTHAFLDSGGHMTDLGTMGGSTFSTALSINDAGEVVGYGGFDTSGFGTHAFIDQTGVMTDIGAAFGPGSSYAFDVNNSGQVTGLYQATGDTQAFLYDADGAVTYIAGLGGGTHGWSLNDFGVVVGSSYLDHAETRLDAFVYQNGVTSDLNDLIAPNSGWDLIEALNIDNAGDIVGSGVFNGEDRGFLLTPISSGTPEPGAWALMILGFGAAGAALRRRRLSASCAI